VTSSAFRGALILVLASMLRCVGYVPGIELELEYRAVPNAREDLRLDEAAVSIVAVELIACERLAFDVGRLWDGHWGMPRARAHAPVETEHTIAFDAMAEPNVFGGLMLPEPGRYCGVRLHMSPQPMRDAHTFLLAGELEDEPFVVFSDDSVDVEMTCDAPIELADASRTTVAIDLDPSAWLDDSDGVARADLDPESFRCRFAPAP